MRQQQSSRWWDGTQYQWGYWEGHRWVTTAYETKGKEKGRGKGKSLQGLPAAPATKKDSGNESHRAKGKAAESHEGQNQADTDSLPDFDDSEAEAPGGAVPKVSIETGPEKRGPPQAEEADAEAKKPRAGEEGAEKGAEKVEAPEQPEATQGHEADPKAENSDIKDSEI
jgi:hypothetical protein